MTVQAWQIGNHTIPREVTDGKKIAPYEGADRAYRVNEALSYRGGDWLVQGEEGELFLVNRIIFERDFELL